MKIGYARVSTNEQNTYLQQTQSKVFGCTKIFFEHESGYNKNGEQFK